MGISRTRPSSPNNECPQEPEEPDTRPARRTGQNAPRVRNSQPGQPGGDTFPATLTVGSTDKGKRLDVFLAALLRGHGISREKLKILIRSGDVLLNGAPASAPRVPLSAGDVVTLHAPLSAASLRPEQGDLEILYRDQVLAVLNKPAGLTVHPAPGEPTGTLAHRLISHFPELAAMDGMRPGIVHRLDKDTSGLMLVALTEQCRLALAAQFAAHEIYKEYLALVRGVPDRDSQEIDVPIGRHPTQRTKMAVINKGKPARSLRRTLRADPEGRFSLQSVRIFSGRTHQVRVHMLHTGHPLLGDAVYGSGPQAFQPLKKKTGRPPTACGSGCGAARQMLHAWRLRFNHPLPEKADYSRLPPCASRERDTLCFTCAPPPDFIETVRRCTERSLRVVVTGSPGCGKSLLLDLMREAGIPVFSADAEVARLYAPGGDGHRLLMASYGERFVPDPQKAVDKQALAAAMLGDPALRREVETLLHPLVRHATSRFWEHNASSALCVAEIPLYLESGSFAAERAGPDPPVLVGVHCPFAIRKQRLTGDRGWSDDLVATVESWQWAEDKKMRACDVVVDNSGSLDSFKREAENLIVRLMDIRQQRQEQTVRCFAEQWSVCPLPGDHSQGSASGQG